MISQVQTELIFKSHEPAIKVNTSSSHTVKRFSLRTAMVMDRFLEEQLLRHEVSILAQEASCTQNIAG